MSGVRLAAAILAMSTTLPAAAPVGGRIRQAIVKSPIARSAFWGIEVLDLQTGASVFSLNSDHFFVPASNAKLFTTALALTRLGPDYRVRTSVFSASAPDSTGLISGDVVLQGGGDPNLSGRAIPYDMDAPRGDPLTAIEDLAAQLAARGVRRITGNIVGDDSAFIWDPYPEGWGLQDPMSGNGPPVSALVINDNTIELHVAPGESEGEPAHINWVPDIPAFEIANRVLTTSGIEKSIHTERLPGSALLRIYGMIPRGSEPETITLAVEDPALFAAMAFKGALVRRGITVDGKAVAHHLYAGDLIPTTPSSPVSVLAERSSPPLIEDLRVIEKVSQNLHAEVILRDVAKQANGVGSRQAALEMMRDFLQSAGIPAEDYSFHDASGLSRLNVVTPHTIAQLLRYMGTSALREQWMSLLPVGGVDGSLANRFTNKRVKSHIMAKTGTLSHTSALSGYIERRNGRTVAFCIMVNNYLGPASEIRAVIDKISNLIRE